MGVGKGKGQCANTGLFQIRLPPGTPIRINILARPYRRVKGAVSGGGRNPIKTKGDDHP